jgi:hypothetical protein
LLFRSLPVKYFFSFRGLFFCCFRPHIPCRIANFLCGRYNFRDFLLRGDRRFFSGRLSRRCILPEPGACHFFIRLGNRKVFLFLPGLFGISQR